MMNKTVLGERNKNEIIDNTCGILKIDSVISTLSEYSHLILIMTQRNRYYYYPLSSIK